jgi:hypothetical protein
MVGNITGWLLSAVIALSGGYGLWTLSQPPRVSTPSGVFPNLLSKVALPADPKSVAPVPMTGDCDAGEKYRAAITEFLANRPQYDKWYGKANTAMTDKPRAVELLVEASHCGRMDLFRRAPAEVINYDPEPAPLDAIERLGAMATQRGMLLRKTQPDEARRYLGAAFVLGYHLYNERLAWREFTAGVNLMREASIYLKELEPDPGRARALELFADAADKYKLDQLKLYGVLSTTDGATLARHGGDAFALARNSPDPMWRTTAILALGRMKYNTPNRGDQLAAPRELQSWTADPDPAARAAAAAASNLTLEQYRMLR